MPNLLTALANLQELQSFYLPSYYGSANRMNSIGVALEFFVKDSFCGTLGIKDLSEKEKAYPASLSYIGNTNNPPDFIVKAGDAVEVKKLEKRESSIALNSSAPKHKLYADDPRITAACRNCEDSEWGEKDIVYAVGVVSKGAVESLWFVYGDCYAAQRNVYQAVAKRVADSIQQSGDIDPPVTRELGRVNKVDPLGITHLRIRGMWGIENPKKVFNYLNIPENEKPIIVALMREEKFNSFPAQDKERLAALSSKGVSITDADIKDPDNPAKFIRAKLIKLHHS